MSTRSITEDIAELRAMTVPELVARYEDVFAKPPRIKHKAWLWKRVAWKLSERRLGGLSKVAQARLEELIDDIELPLEHPPAPAARPRGDVTPGTTLVREWRGRQIKVHVLDNGFEYDGQHYGSLSGVAKAVTASHWNGRLFFGLTGKRTRA